MRITILLLAIATLSARVELYRRINQASECTINNVEVFLPFLLAVWDAFRTQRSLDLRQEEMPDSSIYDSIRSALRTYAISHRTRYLAPAFLLSYGCYLTQGLWGATKSTYICPRALDESRMIPLLQICCLVLDFCLLAIAYESSPKVDGRGLTGRRCVILWSSVMTSTSVIWSITGAAFYIFKPEIRHWLLFLYPALELGTILALAGHVFVFCIFCVSLLHCVGSTEPLLTPLLT